MRGACNVAGTASAGEGVRRKRLVGVLGPEPGLQHGFGQLLDEQGHAVRPLHDLLHDFVRQSPIAEHLLDQRLARRAASAD